MVENRRETIRENRRERNSTRKQIKKQAFVFTLDALLVLPLIIIIISSLIAFSVTLKENVLLHEYTFMIAKDSMNYLSELEIGKASIAGLSPGSEGSLSVLEYTIRHIQSKSTCALAIGGALNSTIPSFAGYIFEYKNGTVWEEIARGGNVAKLATGNYSFQVSAIKVVSSLSDPQLVQDPCSASVTCTTPYSLYNKGEIVGPLMFRIRVFA